MSITRSHNASSMASMVGARVDARIGRQNVDSPVLGDDAGRHRLDRSPIGDVGGDCDVSRPSVRNAVAVDSASAPSTSAITTRAPLGSEHRGDPATDSLRAARHDCDLIGESLHGAPPLDAKYNRPPQCSASWPATRSTLTAQITRRSARCEAGRALRGRVRRGLVGLLPRSLRLHARAPRGGGGAQMGRRRARSPSPVRDAGEQSRSRSTPSSHDPRRRRLRRLHRDRPFRVVGRRDSLRRSFQRRTASCTSTTERRCRHGR